MLDRKGEVKPLARDDNDGELLGLGVITAETIFTAKAVDGNEHVIQRGLLAEGRNRKGGGVCDGKRQRPILAATLKQSPSLW